MSPETDRKQQQLSFLRTIEALKLVERRHVVPDESRQENSAEHSWSLAMMTLLLAEHSPEPVDTLKAIKMALIHDIVEVDAGDTYVHDPQALVGQAEREEAAASRLYGLLPEEQGIELRALFDEFESGSSPEAKLVRALDRLTALLLHDLTDGCTWRENGVSAKSVEKRVAEIETSLPAFWGQAVSWIERAVADGSLKNSF